MAKQFDVDYALRTYISNNGIKPEDFKPENIQKFGFHGDRECKVGGDPYPKMIFVDRATELRQRVSDQAQKPEWYHILALHVIREHEVGEFGAGFYYYMNYHLAELLANGESFDAGE